MAIKKLVKRALRVMPGGVNSPVRAGRAVGGAPLFVSRASGADLWDVDGRRYIDYICSWGPLILGHAHPVVTRAINAAAKRGTSFGASTAAEVELAEVISRAIPSMQMLRLVSSGTEAVMSALRLARGFTGRELLLKFNGCYHGHGDALLVKAGSGVATQGMADSAGVPAAVASKTLVAEYNDLDGAMSVFARHGRKIAAVIVEAVAGNMGLVLPRPGFLAGLRRLCDQYGVLLIFDEVITGFRLRFGGYQDICGVRPDLTTLGKIIGGGLPMGAYGGRREIMRQVSPLGPVYQAGTLSGNPVAVAAGLATLRCLAKPGLYRRLATRASRLTAGLGAAAERAGCAVRVNQLGSMFTLFFQSGEVVDFASASRSDRRRFACYYQLMRRRGICLPPSQFETCFVSLAHSERDIIRTIRAAEKALAELAKHKFAVGGS